MNKKKITAIISVGIIVAIAIFFAIDGVNNKKPSEKEKTTVTENKKSASEINQEQIEKTKKNNPEGNVIVGEQTQDNPNIKSIDDDVYFKIQSKIRKQIDYPKLQEEFKKYLLDNMLMTENTEATCNGILICDYEKDYVSFDLQLNNYARTIVTVVYGSDGNYEFAH